MYTKSFECLGQLYTLLDLEPPSVYNESLLTEWKLFIGMNRTFCVDRSLGSMHTPTFVSKVHTTTPIHIQKIAFKNIERLDFVAQLAQLMRKVYNNMEPDESKKIRSHTGAVPTTTAVSKRTVPTSTEPPEFDLNWVMNIVGLLMNIVQNHKDKLNMVVLLDSLPPVVRTAFTTCEVFIRDNSSELLELDPIELAYRVLSNDGCRMSLKHAYPLFTQSQIKSTIDIISTNMSTNLGLSVGETGGVPPMMASILSMAMQGDGMPNLSAFESMFK